MSELSAPGPPGLPPESPARETNDRSANVVVSWIIILGATALLFIANFHHASVPASDSGAMTPPRGQFLISARYAVGLKEFLPQPAIASNLPKLLQSVDKAAKTPADRLRAAIVAGELLGRGESSKRFDLLEPKIERTPLADDLSALELIDRRGVDGLNALQRHALVEHHGWFGRLALSRGRPLSDPVRRQTLHEAHLTVIALGGVSVLVLCGLGGGIVLMVLGIVRWSEGKIVPAYRPTADSTSPFLEGFAVFLLLYLLMGLLLAALPSLPRLGLVRLLGGIIPVLPAVFWPLWRGKNPRQWRRGIGWIRGRGVLHEIVIGWIGYIAGLPVLAIGLGTTILIMHMTGVDVMHPIVNEANGTAASTLRILILAALWAPLAEETLFRGLLFHHLRHRHGWWTSALAVSLLFAALHPQGFAAIPVLASIALVLAAIREWRGSIFASAAAHALNNAVVTTMLVVATS